MAYTQIERFVSTHFRNIVHSPLQFGPHINCIFGQNGNGKTNLLEAIYFFSNKKSFRKNTSFSQILSIDCEKNQLSIQLLLKNENCKSSEPFSLLIDQEKISFFYQGRPYKNRVDLKTVFINPFDSFLFHQTPSFRREWFDHYLSLLDSDYKHSLARYAQFLRQRNVLLEKKPIKFKEQIYAIDDLLAPLILFIEQKRVSFLEELNNLVEGIFKEIFDQENVLKITLSPSIGILGKSNEFLHEIREKMIKNLEKDLINGRTTHGPHRDDFVLFFDGFNSLEYCSLGQQKMSYLSLLFAYIRLFRYKFMYFPIVLMDDVSGELDETRWSHLIDFLKKQNFQIFITTANEQFKKELTSIEGSALFEVVNGKISRIPNAFEFSHK